MKNQKLTELLRHAYQWGRDNGSNRSEKNFNDFLQVEAVQEALSIANVVGRSEQCCEPLPKDSFYLGMTCPKCNKPFRIHECE